MGDTVTIPLPSWALSVAKTNNYLYTDQWGYQSDEYIPALADTLSIFPTNTGGKNRTLIQVYTDYMSAFATQMKSYISDGTIDNVQVGGGPCGELRYPSYPSAKWNFPGIGAFQAWDPLMIADFKSKASAAGHPEWNSPPTDAGGYNSKP